MEKMMSSSVSDNLFCLHSKVSIVQHPPLFRAMPYESIIRGVCSLLDGLVSHQRTHLISNLSRPSMRQIPLPLFDPTNWDMYTNV